MTRRSCFLIALSLAACGKNEPMPADLFPENAAGGWRRVSVQDMPVSDAPDPVPRTEVTLLRTASYQGPGKLEARVYQLVSPEVGAALAQRWRPSSDTIFFNRGRYFAVVKWEAADRQALQAYIAELENRLGPVKAQ